MPPCRPINPPARVTDRPTVNRRHPAPEPTGQGSLPPSNLPPINTQMKFPGFGVSSAGSSQYELRVSVCRWSYRPIASFGSTVLVWHSRVMVPAMPSQSLPNLSGSICVQSSPVARSTSPPRGHETRPPGPGRIRRRQEPRGRAEPPPRTGRNHRERASRHAPGTRLQPRARDASHRGRHRGAVTHGIRDQRTQPPITAPGPFRHKPERAFLVGSRSLRGSAINRYPKKP